jgi:biotin carboxyl carrier protein
MVRQSFRIGLIVAAMLIEFVPASLDAQSKSLKKGAAKKSPAKTPGSITETPAKEGAAKETPGNTEAEPTSAEIVIRRQPIHLRPAEKYQVSMHLEPVRTVRLAAPMDGTVKTVLHKAGDKLESEAEIIRLDATEKNLQLARARALHKAATLDAQHASAGSLGKDLADARLDAAKADLDLAQYWVDRTSVRTPFKCEVFRVAVSEGQVVRLGDTLATVGDTSVLKAELPVDRNTTSLGMSLQVKVEDRTVAAKVESVLPLGARFEALRDLMPSAASAVVLFENADGRLKSGQTVFSPLIPREPVLEVSNAAIANSTDGSHKVQVLRDSVVRDVPIVALASIGADRSFISGAFESSDELILSTTPPQELPDGTVVRAAQAPPQPVKGAAANRTKSPGTENPAEPTTRPGI